MPLEDYNIEEAFEKKYADKEHKKLMEALGELIVEIKKSEINGEQFERLTNKKLMEVLRELIGAIRKLETNDGKVLKTISDSNNLINIFLDKVKDLSKPQEISVNAPPVNVNQDEVVKELKLVVEELKNNKMPNENKEWEFKVIRGHGGDIDKVIATNK